MRALEDDEPELGGLGAPPAAHEHRNAELHLELPDLVGDVRLHGVERVGGGGERAFFGDGEEGVEVA